MSSNSSLGFRVSGQERGALEVQQTTWQLGGLCLALARLVLLVRTQLHHQRLPFPHTAAPKSIGQSGGPTLPQKGRPHNTPQRVTKHKERHMRPVACMSVLLLLVFRCLRHVLEPQKPKPRVRLIPHLSSPLLEPPVKVGSQGVLAIQLTAIGTHALQAVGPQDWPMALYTIFCRTFGLLSHTANVQLPRHGPTSSLFSQAHSARSGRSQASLLPTIPI